MNSSFNTTRSAINHQHRRRHQSFVLFMIVSISSSVTTRTTAFTPSLIHNLCPRHLSLRRLLTRGYISRNHYMSKKIETIKQQRQEVDTESESSPRIRGQRLLWNGPHFGRLTRSTKKFLLEHNWTELSSPPSPFSNKNRDNDDITNKEITNEENPLAFLWPSKSGPRYPTNKIYPAYVRPYPTEMTLFLEDKILLAKLTEGTNIMAKHFSSKDIIDHAAATNGGDERLYFVKHKLGALGKSVYVHNATSLSSWIQKTKNDEDFVIQEEVIPALDDTKRKFVLRAHLLLYHSGRSSPVFALHQDIIYLPHATPYEPNPKANKSSHISQYGKKHPKPMLLSELKNEHHPAVSYNAQDQIRQSCIILSELISNHFDRMQREGNDKIPPPNVTCFALMGLDYLLSYDGIIKLCEVNTHPALGWGSMSNVDKNVYDRLIQETLRILLFDRVLEETGFEKLI